MFLNRIVPQAGAEHFKTYAISAPISTHFRPATCAEAECGAHTNGWKTLADETTTQGQWIAAEVRRSGRRFTVTREAGITAFVFEPGQTCFAVSKHRVPLERDPVFLVKGGDFRGNPRGIELVTRKPEDWVDDFATHQDKVAAAVQRG